MPALPFLGDPNDKMAPAVAIEVQDIPLDLGVIQHVSRVEYEHADGMAAVCKIIAANKDFVVTDRNVFREGNEVTVRMGYGTQLGYVGRAVITKVRPNFPRDGVPTVEVTAYSRDVMMMEHEPLVPAERKFDDELFSEVVKKKAGAPPYLFDTDVDVTPGKSSLIQKSGMKDYELVKGLANLTGFIFWVDYDEERKKWVLHFRDPAKALEQDKVYTFQYNNGDFSTLLDFEPESAIKGLSTKLTIQTRNPVTGKVMETTLDETAEPPADAKFEGDLAKTTTEELGAGAAVKLFFNNFSFEVVAGKRFTDEAAVKAWANAWFKAQRDNFIMARGTVIGVETLRARQIHNISGVGRAYSGAYYFSTVRHIYDAQNGYTVDFNARKVIK